MAILPNSDLYVIILVLGLGYFILSTILDLELLLGHYSLGVPYGLIGWGIIGLISNLEPSSFILGFLLVWFIISGIYRYLSSYTTTYDRYFLKSALVTIPIKPGKMGEIKVARDGGFDFLSAFAENLSKPLTKGENVRIIDFQGVNALVSTEYGEVKLENTFSRVYNFLAQFNRLLTFKSKHTGMCVVCYGNVKPKDKSISCPSCDAFAHFNHLKDWIQIRPFCPNCRTKLRFEGSKLLISQI